METEQNKEIIPCIILASIAWIVILVFMVLVGNVEFKYQQKKRAEFNKWYTSENGKQMYITVIKKYTSENEYTGVIGGINAGWVIEKGQIKTNKMYYLVDENYNDHLASMDVYNKVDTGVYLVNSSLICREERNKDSCYYIIDNIIKKIK